MDNTASPAEYPAQPALVRYPAPVLRRPAAPVTLFDATLAAFCQRMFQVMEDERGVGLAAPQVGVSRRIFVTDHARKKDGESPCPRIWINPRIVEPEGTTVYEEGCLSFPGIYAKVKRHDRFAIHWQDVHGIEHSERLDVGAGQFLGIVVQHELDHLDGVLMIDRMGALKKRIVDRKMRRRAESRASAR